MWRSLFIASMLGTVLLAGCNTNKGALNHETPMQEMRNGVNDVIDNNRVRETVPNTVNPTPTNPVNPTVPTVPRTGVNEGTMNNGVNETTEKFTGPNGTVEERIIDKNNNVDVKVRERMNK